MVVPRVWSDKGAQFSMARTFGDRCRRGRSCAVHGGACHPSTRRVAPKTRANHGFATAIARPVFWRSSSLRDGVGSRIHGSQRRGLGFVDRVQREGDCVVGIILHQVGIQRSLARVEVVCGVFDACPRFGRVGVPAVVDRLPLRRRVIAGGVCLGLQLIGGGSCPVSRLGSVGFELIPGTGAGGLQFVGRGFQPGQRSARILRSDRYLP